MTKRREVDPNKKPEDCLKVKKKKTLESMGDAFVNNQDLKNKRYPKWVKAKRVRRAEKSLMEAKELTESMKDKGLEPDVLDMVEIVEKEEEVVWQPQQKANQWHPRGPQVEFLEANEDEVLFSGGRGSGKGLAYGSKVLTKNGWLDISEVSVGTEVCTPTGEYSKVIAIPYDDDIDPCYIVTFQDGRSVEVTSNHLWNVNYTGGKRAQVINTETLFNQIDSESFSVQLSSAVDINKDAEEPFNLDPYILGLLIGDGCLRPCGKDKVIRLYTIDQEITDYCDEHYEFGVSYYERDQGMRFLKPLKLANYLETLNLYNTLSNNKFVPETYKQGSIETRLSVLQGLMDTDGYVDKGGSLEFSTVSEQLALDVQYIIRSLGGKATISTKIGSYRDSEGNKVECQIVYRLYIKIRDSKSLFRLPRKKELCKESGTEFATNRNRIIDIQPIEGKVKAKCITIDSEDGLFITKDFIVTHNSDCLIVDPLRYCYNKNFRGLLLRRTMPELRELINRAKDLYPRLHPGTKWKEQEKLFTFPSGAKIEFGYCERPDDLERYRGQQYTWLGVDEITQFPTSDVIDTLQASLRTTDPNLKIYVRATTNPSGAGVGWVKEHWADKCEPGNRYTESYDTSLGVMHTTRKWIQSLPEDNEILMRNNPQYLAKLHGIQNEAKRNQWLYGSWDCIEGLAFSEFNLKTHVCTPFSIPHNWRRWRAADWGYSGGLAVCLWFAQDWDNNIYVYREFACNGSKAQPHERLRADMFALKVRELEAYENVHAGYLDSSVWSTRGEVGETPADTMLKMGCNWIPSDRSKGSRVAGKMLIHDYLRIDEDTGQPKIKIFSNCKQIIKELRSLVLDDKNPEDVDTKQEDHAYDALRYGLSAAGSSPVSPFNSNAWDDRPIIINKDIGV